jgi:hypothetical protein
MSQLARCVIPPGTLAILDSDEDGLIRIYCSNAQGGVLAKVGFFAVSFTLCKKFIRSYFQMNQSKTDAHSTTVKDSGFGSKRLVPEKIDDFGKFMGDQKTKPVKSILKQSKVPPAASKAVVEVASE